MDLPLPVPPAHPGPVPPALPGAIVAPSLGWGGQVGAARAAVQKAIADRETADLRLSYFWVILFFVSPSIKSFFITLAWLAFWPSLNIIAALIFLLIAGLISSFFHGTVNRTLVRRMTRHFDREARMRAALIDYLHAKAAAEGKLDVVASHLLSMATIHGQAMALDKGRSVWWSVATALPLLRFYFMWFINKFPSEHEKRWLQFMDHAGRACAAMGVPFQVPPLKPVKRHNYWLFLAVSLLTNEFFWGIWYLFLIRDPHVHFDNHVKADDALSLALH